VLSRGARLVPSGLWQQYGFADFARAREFEDLWVRGEISNFE
jgi:hypothetical protein